MGRCSRQPTDGIAVRPYSRLPGQFNPSRDRNATAVNAREVVAVSGATIRQIAEAMGVGIATVHRAVSGDVPNGTDQQPDDLLEDAGENSLSPEPVDLSPDPVNQAVRQV